MKETMGEEWDRIEARLRAAEAERDRLREDYAEAQAGWDKVSDENDRLREFYEAWKVVEQGVASFELHDAAVARLKHAVAALEGTSDE